jgi:hypothetical protein
VDLDTVNPATTDLGTVGRSTLDFRMLDGSAVDRAPGCLRTAGGSTVRIALAGHRTGLTVGPAHRVGHHSGAPTGEPAPVHIVELMYENYRRGLTLSALAVTP